MNLGLEGLVEPKEETVMIDHVDIDTELSELDDVVTHVESMETVNETMAELAAVIKEHGFTPAMESLYGEELASVGIDTTLDKDDLATLIANYGGCEINEEGAFSNFFKGLRTPAELLVGLKTLWGNIGNFITKKGLLVKSKLLVLKPGVGSIWSKIVPFLAGVNVWYWVAIASITTVLVTIKIVNSVAIRKLMTNKLNMVDDERVEKLLSKTQTVYNAKEFAAKLNNLNDIGKMLQSGKIASLTVDMLKSKKEEVTTKLESAKTVLSEAGYDANTIIKQHDIAISIYAIMDDLVKNIKSIKLSDKEEKVDKEVVDAAKDLAVTTAKTMNSMITTHIKFVKQFAK